MGIYEKLLNIQMELKAPKNQYSDFGSYSYRSCEDVLEALKPLCKKHGCVLLVTDSVVQVGDRNYIQAEAKLLEIETKESESCTAFAREPDNKPKLDSSQVTGSASSYARKYALNGLFCIDDTKDSDALPPDKPTTKKTDKKIDSNRITPEKVTCDKCGAAVQGYTGKNGTKYTPAQSKENMGGMCADCYRKAKNGG